MSNDTIEKKNDVSVTALVDELADALESAIGEIDDVNAETKMLSLNARIEAARAGTFGAAFGVVAEEMQTLSDRTAAIAESMASRTRDKTTELTELIDCNIRGTRLSDLALVNIDLIDRNLYERTCDVRWWATDGSLVQAVTDPTPENCRFASKRLGVILDAYTVYFDLVLCDLSGRIIANGRPNDYASINTDQSTAPWFRQAIGSKSGDEYGFQSAHNSGLVHNKPVLIYSCGVREDGEANGKLLGTLGILFNWDGLSGPILNGIPVAPSERATTKAAIVDADGTVVASCQDKEVGKRIQLPDFQRVLQKDRGFFLFRQNGQQYCVGHAKAPGFETYSTNWYSLIIQPIEASSTATPGK